MTHQEKIIYLSGLFDGEGSFSIQVQLRQSKNGINSCNFNPRMTMNLYYGWEKPLNLLQEVFGGKIYHSGVGHSWYLSKREPTIKAAIMLYPYLTIKQDICKKYLEALSIFPTKRKDHLRGERSWSVEKCLEVAEIALTLNPISARKSKKNLNYLEDIKKAFNEKNKLSNQFSESTGESII